MCYCDCFAGLFANFLMSVNSNEPHNSVIQITGIPSVGLNATPRNGPTYDQLLCLYFLSTKWAEYPIVPTCESFPAVLFLFRKPNEQSNKAHGRLTVWQVTSKSHLIIETKHRHPPPPPPISSCHLVSYVQEHWECLDKEKEHLGQQLDRLVQENRGLLQQKMSLGLEVVTYR